MRKTVTNIIYNAVYQVFLVLLPIITVPYLTKVLGANNLGVYSTVNYTIQFLMVFCTIAMGQIGTRTIAKVRIKENKAELSNTFWGLWFIQFFISLAVIILFTSIIIIFDPGYKIFLLLQIPFLFSAMFDISWFFQGIADFGRVVVRNTAVKLLGVTLIFIFVKSKDDLANYMLIMSLSTFIGSLTFWPQMRRKVKKPYFHFYNLRATLIASATLLVPQLAMQVYNSLDKPILKMFQSAAQVAFYDNSQRVSKIILGIITSITIVMMPKMASSSEKDQQVYLKKSFETTVLLGLLFSIIVMINTRQFVPWFFQKEFIPMTPLMFFVSLTIIIIPIGGVFANQFALARRRDKEFAIPVIIGAVLSLVLNFTLDPVWGAAAATANIMIVELFVCILRVWIVRKDYDAKYVFKDWYKYIALFLITFTMGMLLPNILSNTFLNMAYKSIVIVFVYFVLFSIGRFELASDLKRLISKRLKRG